LPLPHRAKERWRRRLAGFPAAYERLVEQMEPGTWYLLRELVPFMPEHIRMPHKCGHVIKRAFDYRLIERKRLETKGQHETFTMGRNVRLSISADSVGCNLIVVRC
jgi:hypothetical protein